MLLQLPDQSKTEKKCMGKEGVPLSKKQPPGGGFRGFGTLPRKERKRIQRHGGAKGLKTGKKKFRFLGKVKRVQQKGEKTGQKKGGG